MIHVLADCLERSDEEGARHGFDVFETLLILVRGDAMVTINSLITRFRKRHFFRSICQSWLSFSCAAEEIRITRLPSVLCR